MSDALLLGEREPVIPLSTVHGWTGHSDRERRFYYPLDRRLLARYPRLVAVSGQIKDELVASGSDPARVTVVLNAIDPDRFRRDPARVPEARTRFGWTPADYVIGAVGRLEPQKRFDLLIDAVASLRATYPALRLMIAGEGSSREALERHEILPLAGILAKVKRTYGDNVVNIEYEEEQGRRVYEFEIVEHSGQVIEIHVDAATGKVIQGDEDQD